MTRLDYDKSSNRIPELENPRRFGLLTSRIEWIMRSTRVQYRTFTAFCPPGRQMDTHYANHKLQ